MTNSEMEKLLLKLSSDLRSKFRSDIIELLQSASQLRNDEIVAVELAIMKGQRFLVLMLCRLARGDRSDAEPVQLIEGLFDPIRTVSEIADVFRLLPHSLEQHQTIKTDYFTKRSFSALGPGLRQIAAHDIPIRATPGRPMVSAESC
jgi:hypothetical protein